MRHIAAGKRACRAQWKAPDARAGCQCGRSNSGGISRRHGWKAHESDICSPPVLRAAWMGAGGGGGPGSAGACRSWRGAQWSFGAEKCAGRGFRAAGYAAIARPTCSQLGQLGLCGQSKTHSRRLQCGRLSTVSTHQLNGISGARRIFATAHQRGFLSVRVWRPNLGLRQMSRGPWNDA